MIWLAQEATTWFGFLFESLKNYYNFIQNGYKKVTQYPLLVIFQFLITDFFQTHFFLVQT
jgi:hypothetical protein